MPAAKILKISRFYQFKRTTSHLIYIVEKRKKNVEDKEKPKKGKVFKERSRRKVRLEKTKAKNAQEKQIAQ